jgi:hypothetical protein
MKCHGLSPLPGSPWVALGKGGRGVPRLLFVRSCYTYEMSADLPCRNHEQTLPLLYQPKFRQILIYVADVIACAADVMEEHEEVVLMLRACG